MNKSEVREYAYKKGLPNHDKPDSTGICFIGERPFKEFIQAFVPPKPGDIVNTDGEFLGNHDGLAYFTIGQRKDIGIGGMKNHSGEPWYVADKDMNSNKLIVVQGRDHALLWKKKVFVGSLNWLDDGIAATIRNREIIECEAKSRYRQDDAKCSFKALNDGVIVEFNDSQWAITKGQYLVFYKEGKCLGGGKIMSESYSSD
jgi:tRNA-specific 2-thiouridylase